MNKILPKLLPLAKPIVPALLGILGTLVAISFPSYHVAFCSGAL